MAKNFLAIYISAGHKSQSMMLLAILIKIEILVLWAWSETISNAVNICRGMMEYWNVGILKPRV